LDVVELHRPAIKEDSTPLFVGSGQPRAVKTIAPERKIRTAVVKREIRFKVHPFL
jgi:hypothetical protein